MYTVIDMCDETVWLFQVVNICIAHRLLLFLSHHQGEKLCFHLERGMELFCLQVHVRTRQHTKPVTCDGADPYMQRTLTGVLLPYYALVGHCLLALGAIDTLP